MGVLLLYVVSKSLRTAVLSVAGGDLVSRCSECRHAGPYDTCLLAIAQHLNEAGARVSKLAACPRFKEKAGAMSLDEWAKARGYA